MKENMIYRKVEGTRFKYTLTGNIASQYYSINVFDSHSSRMVCSLIFYKGQIRIFKDEENNLTNKVIAAFRKRKGYWPVVKSFTHTLVTPEG